MTETQTFPVRLDVEFSDDDIDLHIMGSGCFMWGWWYSVDTAPVSPGFLIKVMDPNHDDEVLSKVITYRSIRRVLSNICADAYPNAEFYSSAKRTIMEGIRTGDWDFDSDAADQIMQIAMFGKVVFG